MRCLIIGAGMSGLLAAIKLREAGFDDLVIFEKAGRIGGTWRDNTYPGLRCDVPSHMFTYSFQANPNYSTRFPAGAEIQSYLEDVCNHHGVYSLIQFNKTVSHLSFDNGKWVVQCADGDIDVYDIVVNATGVLRNPNYPDIPGRQDFQGKSFHSSQWDHTINWEEARVGIIGTGATSVQIVPELARKARRLVVFQRTPQWIFPMPNKSYSASEQERLRRSPNFARKLRWRYSKIFQWTFGRAVIGNPLLLWIFNAFCSAHLRRKVADPELRQKLTPKYHTGCKRLVFAKGYYQSIQKPNVQLETNNIVNVDSSRVYCEGGTAHELDVLIYATGFRAHDYMRPMRLTGESGVSIDQVWKDGAFSYRSTMIPGFPNYFLMFGPYSPIGNYSAISVAETQVGFIVKVLKTMASEGMDLVQPRYDCTAQLLDKLKQGIQKTVWVSGCTSWYQDGLGNIPMWPWTFEAFEKQLSRVRRNELLFSRKSAESETGDITYIRSKLNSSASQPTASAANTMDEVHQPVAEVPGQRHPKHGLLTRHVA